MMFALPATDLILALTSVVYYIGKMIKMFLHFRQNYPMFALAGK